jgi:hypothetical protein
MAAGVSAVVGLAISMFEKLEIDKLWIVFGKGKYLKWIPIREILNALGKRALDLPFSHAVTCCDTVSTFLYVRATLPWLVECHDTGHRWQQVFRSSE